MLISKTGDYTLNVTKPGFITASQAISIFAEIAADPVAVSLRLSPPDYLRFTFRNSSNASDTVAALAVDPDDAGPLPATADTIRLKNNTTYNVAVSVRNLSAAGFDLDSEVAREKNAYRFVYGVEGIASGVTVANLNLDDYLSEFGTALTVQIGSISASNGVLRVSLRFYQTLNKSGLNFGTEFTVGFPLVIGTSL